MPLDLDRIQALCFDVDGTLSNTDDVYAKRFAGWLSHVPFIPAPQQASRHLVMWLESPGNALMGLSDTLGLDSLIFPFLNWMYRNVKTLRGDYLVVEGVAAMLPRLKPRFPMADSCSNVSLPTTSR